MKKVKIENNPSSNRLSHIITIMQEIADKVKSKGIVTKNYFFECQYIEKMFLNIYQTLENKNIIKITNKSAYDLSEKEIYKKLKAVQKTLNLSKTDAIGKIIRLTPKPEIGDLYVPLKALSLETEKEELIVNKNQGITVINFWNEDAIETHLGLKQMVNCIERNKNFYKKHNVQFFALHQKSEYNNTKEYIKDMKLDKHVELLKHFYFEDKDFQMLECFEIFTNYVDKQFFIIANKQGIIRHLGHFYEFPLEDKIEEILKMQQEEEEEKESKILNGSEQMNKNNSVENMKNYMSNDKLIAKLAKEKLEKEKKICEMEKTKDLELKESLKTTEKTNPFEMKFFDYMEQDIFNSETFDDGDLWGLKALYKNKEDNNDAKEGEEYLSLLSKFTSKKPNNTLSKVHFQKLNINENNKSGDHSSSIHPEIWDLSSNYKNPSATSKNFDAFKAEFAKLYSSSNSPLKVKYKMYAEVTKIFKYKINLKDLKIIPSDQEDENSNADEPEFLIKIECFSKEMKVFESLLKQFFTQEEIEKNKFSITEIPNIALKIEPTNSCYLCQVVLNMTKDLQYYCVECRISFCRKCVKSYKNKDKSGLDVLVHKEHYLIAFKNPNKKSLEDIAKFKLGSNLFSMLKPDQLNREHNFGCDVCNVSNCQEERYICLNCRPGLLQDGGFTDVCAKCFKKGIKQDTNNLSIKADEHKPNHVFLHLVYSGVNYYNY